MDRQQEWQEQTDITLDRIESQLDSTDKQTGFAADFREKVITGLTRIEDALVQNEKDHKDIKDVISKIPAMEIGLSNHLHSHDNFKKYVTYPILVAIIVGIIGLFCKVILRVF